MKTSNINLENYFNQAVEEINNQNEEHDFQNVWASLEILKATQEYLTTGGTVADEIGLPIIIKSFVDYMEAFAQVESVAWIELLISEDNPFGRHGSSAEDIYSGTMQILA